MTLSDALWDTILILLAEDPTSYRPISLLSVFSKIIEKLMDTRLYIFLETYNILHSLEFGSRLKHSTLHALFSLTESVKRPLMMECFAVVYLLIYKGIFLHKMERSGIRGTAQNWFASCLSERQQYVSVNGNTSDQ